MLCSDACMDIRCCVADTAMSAHQSKHSKAKSTHAFMLSNRSQFQFMGLWDSMQEAAVEPEAAAEVAGQAPAAAGPFGMASVVEEFMADSFLQQLFAKFFGMVNEEVSANSQIRSVSKQVQQLLEQRLGWDFVVQGVGQNDIDDEYAPVVVQLDSVTL